MTLNLFPVQNPTTQSDNASRLCLNSRPLSGGILYSENTMKEIPLTKGQVTLVDDDMFEYLDQWKWRYSASGYVSRSEWENGSTKNVLLHRVVCNTPEGMETDHINCNKLDNRKSNLRTCTRAQNAQNRPAPKNNASGFKGVSWFKRDKKWIAYIQCNGKKKNLGRYSSPEEAAKIYEKAARELFGEFHYAQ